MDNQGHLEILVSLDCVECKDHKVVMEIRVQ